MVVPPHPRPFWDIMDSKAMQKSNRIEAYQFLSPCEVAVRAGTHELMVVDTGHCRIQTFSLQTNKFIHTQPIDKHVTRVCVTEDGKHMFFLHKNRVHVQSLDSHQVDHWSVSGVEEDKTTGTIFVLQENHVLAYNMRGDLKYRCG